MHISDLWRWDGTVDRRTYAIWGIGLMAVKYNLDRALAAWFGHPWSPFSYLKPGATSGSVTNIAPDAMAFYTLLIVLALPFIWSGVVLTLRRLRDMGLPAWLVVWFFIPLVNMFFFFVLALSPTRTQIPLAEAQATARSVRWLDRLIPTGVLGSGAMAILVTAILGTGLTFVAVNLTAEYGWGLFVGMPFLLGLNASLIHGWHHPRSLASCLFAGATACAVLGTLLLLVAIEGIICIAMAAPIGLALALIGSTVGWAIQNRPGQAVPLPPALVLLVVVLPLMMGAEAQDPGKPPLIAVTTVIEVDAPPARVWTHVVSFSELPPAENWIFKLGVAHPVRARIDGEGVGAVRRCEFSTGPFVEPITVWEPPTRLGFSVTSQPRPMHELSPYAGLKAPHLDNFLKSERGQFLLTALPGNRTRLEGTTWYRHRIWPAAYWQVWSDDIIHRIHTRVLTHVKALSERA